MPSMTASSGRIICGGPGRKYDLDGSMRIGILLLNRKMRFKTLKAAGRKVVGEPYEGKPHVRFEVAGDGNQDMV